MRRARPELLGVLGRPVAHSLSPALHQAALAHEGRDGSYHAFDVGPEELATALRGLATLGARGVNLTAPLKVVGVALVDELDDVAREAGAINTIAISEDGRLRATTTDPEGFVVALREDLGLEPHGLRAVVVGTGGAARAVGVALARGGARAIAIVGRSQERARALAERLGGVVARDGGLGSVDLVVQASSVGMVGGPAPDETAIPQWLLERTGAVMDLVYAPLETPTLRAARDLGIPATNGVTMLAAQARAAYRWWFGSAPELSVFRAGALHGLEGTTESA